MKSDTLRAGIVLAVAGAVLTVGHERTVGMEANGVPPTTLSSPFRSYVADLLAKGESKCVVPETREAWAAMRGRILHGLERMMSRDLPRRWPDLRPVTVGVVQRRGYRIEQVSAEFWPGVRYGMQVFVPDGPGPFPAVIVVATGPDGGRSPVIQRCEIALAELGIMAVGIVPIGKGVRGSEEDAYGYNEIAMLVGTSIRQEQEHCALRTLEYLKWQRFLYASGEPHLFDQIPTIERAAKTAYRHAGASERFSSNTCHCDHGDYPEYQADFITWIYQVFFGRPPARRIAAGPKGHAKDRLRRQHILLDGQAVAVIDAGSVEFGRMKFPDFDEDGGRKAFLPIIEERRTAARHGRAELACQPERLRTELRWSLGVAELTMAPTAGDEGRAILLRTEPNLQVGAEWVRRAADRSRSVSLGVGDRASRSRYHGGGLTRLDLQMREQDALGDELTVLVLLNRPPLGMWVWDCMSAATWLRQKGYSEIELIGVGEAGRIISTLAGLLSDEVTRVETVGDGIHSLDADVVGRRARDTRYWAYRSSGDRRRR